MTFILKLTFRIKLLQNTYNIWLHNICNRLNNDRIRYDNFKYIKTMKKIM